MSVAGVEEENTAINFEPDSTLLTDLDDNQIQICVGSYSNVKMKISEIYLHL